MNRELTLDDEGQIDGAAEQVFRGRNADDEIVQLHISRHEWEQVLEAHSCRRTALDALETLAWEADWSVNEQDGGWTVQLSLPQLRV